MRAVAPLTSVLERIYAPAPTLEEWLEGIRDAASCAFDGHLGVQAYTLELREDAVDIGSVVAHDAEFAELLVEGHRFADGEVARGYRAGAPLLRAAHAMPEPGHPARDYSVSRGVEDVVIALGFADARRGCAISLVIRAETQLARAARTSLARLGAHLGAAYRLRVAAADASEGDAVLTTKGALLHASGGAKASQSRERLRTAALAIARAKRESERDPDAGLAFWTAMVQGQWTIVERTDSDGKKLLIARRNAPSTREHRALTPRERTIVERASYGGSLRHVAYELGLAESTVSETLKRAMKKLGIGSRAELVELRAAIVGPPPQ